MHREGWVSAAASHFRISRQKDKSLPRKARQSSNIHHSLYPLTFEYDYIVLSGK